MACIFQAKCNFLHGHFRCLLPVEVVDTEMKITSMQGTHIFRRDRTTQLIRCTPWSSRLHPHPIVIKKMRTFLEIEGKLGPIPQSPSNQYRPHQPDTNPNIRKATKITEKRKRVALPKRLKANIAMRSNSNEATTRPPVTIAKAPTDFKNQTPSQEGTPESRPPPLEDAPNYTGTPWPEAGKYWETFLRQEKTGYSLPIMQMTILKAQPISLAQKPP